MKSLVIDRRKLLKAAMAASPLVDLAQAHLRLAMHQQTFKPQGGFGEWLEEVTPQWDWKPIHFRYSRWFLNKVTRGEITRLLNFWPVRHGKTEQNTIRYAAYRMELCPTMHILIVAHTQSLATKISRKIKKIVQERIPIAKDKRSGPEWETEAGGSLRAVGVGGVGGGYGADLAILDDVIKHRTEANSPTYRDRMWDSFKDDIMTRLHPGAAVLGTFTRWHEDDLAGRILESDDAHNWTVVRLPALAEEEDPLLGVGPDPLGRKPGAALWPTQWSREYLLERQVAMGDSFEPVYQQNPTPPGGKMFKRHWFNTRWNELPANCKFVRYWDKAGTKGGDGAATAGVLMARTPNTQFVICDVVWGRWEADEREEVILATAKMDGSMTKVWVEQEPGSGGKESAQNTVKTLTSHGFRAESEPVHGDKTLRAEPMQGSAKVGNVILLEDSTDRPWIKKFLNELVTFPQGKMKDQVDAASGAFNKLKLVQKPGTPLASSQRRGLIQTPTQIVVPRRELFTPGL
jgi:predicted phage terminase large subunit-like protein